LFWVATDPEAHPRLIREVDDIFGYGSVTVDSAVATLFRQRDFYQNPLPSNCGAGSLWSYGPRGPFWPAVDFGTGWIKVTVQVDAPVVDRHLALQQIVDSVLANDPRPSCGGSLKRTCRAVRVTIRTPHHTYANLSPDPALIAG